MTPLGLLIIVVNLYSRFDAQADIQKSGLLPPEENDNVYWCRNIVWCCAFCQAETEHVVHHCVKSQASKASVGPPLCLHQSVPHCQPCWPKSNDKYIKSDDTIKTPKGDWNCDLINSQDYVPPSKRPSSIHWP